MGDRKDKTCPDCGGTMQFRLGEYECAQCGYVESLHGSPRKGALQQAPPASNPPPDSARQPAANTQIEWLKWSCLGCSIAAPVFLFIPLAIMSYDSYKQVLSGNSAEPGLEGGIILLVFVASVFFSVLGLLTAIVLFRWIRSQEPGRPFLSLSLAGSISHRMAVEKVLSLIAYFGLIIFGYVQGIFPEVMVSVLLGVIIALAFFVHLKWLKSVTLGCATVYAFFTILSLVIFIVIRLFSAQLAAKYIADTDPSYYSWVNMAIQISLIWAVTLLYRDIRWLKRQEVS